MKKFNDYLNPKTEKEPEKLSLSEQAWQNAKKKIESQEPEKFIPLQEQIVYVKEQVEETPVEIISEEVIPEPTPIVETITVQGERGPMGLKGDKGDRGETGPMGLAGPMGPKGDKGDKGDVGDVGPQGPEGIQGPVGPKGEKGDRGEKGEQGIQGPIGLQGNQGVQGERGEKGDQGEQGLPGLDGKDGAQGIQGEKGEVGPQGPIGLTGPQGEKGEKGDKGDVGPQGEKGEKGDTGPQGPKGKDGLSPDIKPFAEKFNKLSLDINKKVGRIVGDMGALAGGGGSGSYWLNDLGDTDYSSIVNATDGQVLTFDTATKKWKAADATGGVAGADTVARNKASAAYDQANTATLIAQASFDYANTLISDTQTDQIARNTANSGYNQANTATTNAAISDQRAITSGVYANSAFGKANTGTILAQAAFDYANTLVSDTQIDPFARNQANAAFITANTPSHVANSSSLYANSAYSKANTGTILAQAAFDYANTISSNILIIQDVDTAQNTNITIVGSYANSAYSLANSSATSSNLTIAWNTANSASSYVNSAYLQANTATTNAATADQRAVTSGSYANSAYALANSAFTSSNGVISWNTANAASSYANSAYGQANLAYSTAMNSYGLASNAYLNSDEAFNQANSAYSKANTAITTSGGTSTGTITSNNAVAFIAGSAANSGVALQMPNEGALRNMTNGQNTMYFDVSNGGTPHGSFRFRSSSEFTELLDISTDGLRAISAYKGKTPFNSALDTVVTVDNIKYRISNQGGVFPQIASASGSTVDVCYDVEGVVNGTTNPTYANNSGYILLANGTWLSIYSSHGMDARGDRLTAHITDKAAGKIYRATFMKTNNSSNTDGYNIIVERIL